MVAKPCPSQVVIVSSPPGAACPGCEDGEAEDAGEEEAVRGPCVVKCQPTVPLGGLNSIWVGPQRALIKFDFLNVLTAVELLGTILPLEVMRQPLGMASTLEALVEDPPAIPLPGKLLEPVEAVAPDTVVTVAAWSALALISPPSLLMDSHVPDMSPYEYLLPVE